MWTTDSEIGSTFSQKSENQGFSSHYINFRISPVWRRISRQMPESSPNLSSQLLLVSENEQKDGFWQILRIVVQILRIVVQIGGLLVLQDKTELGFHIATSLPLIPLPKLNSFIEFEIEIMWTTDSEIGSTFSQKSENQGFSSHYINFRISPVWRRISRRMLESSPNLSSQLLLVFENEQKDGFAI